MTEHVTSGLRAGPDSIVMGDLEQHSGSCINPESNASSARSQQQETIRCEGLTKLFKERYVVNQLTFSVYEGELYALLGENGAGKTTTINMLVGLLNPSAGRYSICSLDGAHHANRIRGLIGVVSQEVALYGEMTVRENLEFVARLHGVPWETARQRARVLLAQADLLQKANNRAGELSPGQQRNLSIAMSMIHQPKVIFMDEPTTGLDPVTRRQIWERLQELTKSGVTIVLTTHYLEEAELLADRVGIIRKGTMVVEGSVEQLRTQLRAVRTIEVKLTREISEEEREKLIGTFPVLENFQIIFDKLRNAFLFTYPQLGTMTDYLQLVLSWLKEKNIAFEEFATCKPSLEEIFLSVQQPFDSSTQS